MRKALTGRKKSNPFYSKRFIWTLMRGAKGKSILRKRTLNRNVLSSQKSAKSIRS